MAPLAVQAERLRLLALPRIQAPLVLGLFYGVAGIVGLVVLSGAGRLVGLGLLVIAVAFPVARLHQLDLRWPRR